MAIQNSVNSMLGTAVMAAGSKALKQGGKTILNNQEAQMKATDSLKDELASIKNYQNKIKNKFGIELSNTEARILGKTKLSNRNFRTLLQPIDGVVGGD